MEKILRLNLAILFLLFAMMLVSPSAASLKNPAGSITVEAKSKKKPAKKSTTRKPVTRTNYITMKKKEKLWVGPSVAGFHKVTVKKKGKVTISCTVKKTLRGWIKGDVHKWVITIK